MNQRNFAAVVLAAALVASLTACGDDDTGGTPAAATVPTESKNDEAAEDGEETEETELVLVAQSIQWDTDSLSAPVGDVTIVVDNQDSGIRHNVRVTGHGVDEATELEAGPVTQELDLTLPESGTYDYICDIHPNMKGTIEAT